MISTVDTQNITEGTSLNSNPSLSSDEPDEAENSQVVKQNSNGDQTFNMLIKEIVLCIALAITTYGALHNSPPKVSKVPQAVRFFNRDSVVKDWYRGELSHAISHVNAHDISFVMYYAPWDAESQFVRSEFEKAANVMSDWVYFSAVNCWNPGSECRLQHNKIPSWPILIAYTVTSRGVLYKGPKNSESMIKFLESIIKPLEKVSKTEDLVNLLSVCDAVAIGFTPLSETSQYYNIWYSVALKSKEYDTIGEICFASVTSTELAVNLGIEDTPNARLMLWNDTKEFKLEQENHSWNESTLMHWVLGNFVQPVARIMPLWKKSFSFVRYADGNPVFILFTPLNPLYEQLPAYSLLREVAMEYYNLCKDHNSGFQWTTELAKLQHVQRLLYQQKNILKKCQEYNFKKRIKAVNSVNKKKIISHNNKYPLSNVTQKNQGREKFNYLLRHGLAISKLIENSNEHSALWSLGFVEQCGTYKQYLPAEKSIYEKYEKCHSFEEHLHSGVEFNMEDSERETSMLPYEDDQLSAENLMQENIRHYCKVMRYAHTVSPPVMPAKVANGNITHIDGLSCTTNASLSFLAIDSLHNYHFAEALGIDIKNKKDMTASVILDSKQESQYVLSQEYSAKSVREFIYNFTKNRLKRTLRTHVGDAVHTHYFGSSGERATRSRRGAEHGSGRAENDNEGAGPGSNIIHIEELTTRTFRKFIRTPGTVKFVCVCAGACAGHVSRALAAAARLLRACGLGAACARLDAARHDLPWQYTTHLYPMILVFPADGDEAESRAYPAGARVSTSGLVALALRALGPPRDLRVRLALCALPNEFIEKRKCLKDMRHHIFNTIGRHLKYWRRTDIRELKGSMFRRLVYLHQVSLYLSVLHPDDLREHNGREAALMDALEKLSAHWDAAETTHTATLPQAS